MSSVVDKIKNYFTKDKGEFKHLDLRILITFIMTLLLLIVCFRQTYHTAEKINFELQYRTYLKELNNPQNYDIKFDVFENNITMNETRFLNELLYSEPEKLKFPNYLKWLMGISFFMILESFWLTYTKFKRWRNKNYSLPKKKGFNLDSINKNIIEFHNEKSNFRI